MLNPIPDGLSVKDGRLYIDGIDAAGLANEYGTPLYILSQNAIEKACFDYTDAMRSYYPGDSVVAYASKALCFTGIYGIIKHYGMYADVVSGGELYTALRGKMPPDRLIFHGNNKTEKEIAFALENGVLYFAADNFEELERLDRIAGEQQKKPRVALRLKPGIDAHTHEFVQTGNQDSKFGFSMETAHEAAKMVIDSENLTLTGAHCHIGSQIFDAEPFVKAAEILLKFRHELFEKTGVILDDINLGGGYGIRYINSHDPRGIHEAVKTTAEAVVGLCRQYNMPLPRLFLEPGRSIVGAAGITVYTVGSIKTIPDIRTYIAVDGGMTDNPRHALYAAAYTAVLPERMDDIPDKTFTVAGRCCESGDIICSDVKLPDVKAGELLAILSTGAYNYSMSSNYNRVPRPPVIIAYNGSARVAVRRESYEDITVNDL